MWCGIFSGPNETWCVRQVRMIRRVVSLTMPKTGSGSAAARGSGGQMLLQPADVGGQAAVGVGCLADDGGAGRPDHPEQQGRVDGARGDVGVPVLARAGLITRVV